MADEVHLPLLSGIETVLSAKKRTRILQRWPQHPGKKLVNQIIVPDSDGSGPPAGLKFQNLADSISIQALGARLALASMCALTARQLISSSASYSHHPSMWDSPNPSVPPAKALR